MKHSTRALATALLAFHAGATFAAEPLSDDALDAITAGTAPEAAEALKTVGFKASHTTRSGKEVAADGTLTIDPSVQRSTTGSLTISDNAQSNLRSLVNINAVNSPVNVLLNINLSINSQIGELKQLNVASGR